MEKTTAGGRATPGTVTRAMALVCRCCPFCIARRRYPASAYARFLNAAEKNCPFCRAYARVHGSHGGKRSAGPAP